MNRGFLDTRVLMASFGFLLLIIGIFSASRAYGLVEGPVIKLKASSDAEFLVLEGTAYRSAHFFINDVPTPLEQNGNFLERLFLTPGHTIISIRAEDRFGRQDEIQIPIYTPEHASEKKDNNQQD